MIIIEYSKQDHENIIEVAGLAILRGKVVAYPTDTSYGLGALAPKKKAVERVFAIKGRDFNKPIHVIPSSIRDIIDIAHVSKAAKKAMKAFWPGAFTVVLPLLAKKDSNVKNKAAWDAINLLSAKSGHMGFRLPKHQVALGLVNFIEGSVTTTSANVSGTPDSYSGDDVIAQFRARKEKPDILIYVKSIPMRKPSTVVRFDAAGSYEVLREGPVSKKQIEAVLNGK